MIISPERLDPFADGKLFSFFTQFYQFCFLKLSLAL